RGNGKGGGIAAAGLVPEQLGVDKDVLRDDYMLQIALLDPSCERELEESFIKPRLRIDHKARLEPVCDYRDLGLEVRPPDVLRYFVRAKDACERSTEDELIYRNSFALNKRFYASLGEKRAFVLSHSRDLMIIKIVGYAENAVRYYGLEDFKARVWIAHQRYPTKGRVWHPAGAHPFVGMNEALVHNGDFANYHGVSEYLRQHSVEPLFLTDTEVAALLFDLWHRVYRYPLEYVVEALAPTTELDFDRLPEDKKKIYKAIQSSHMHGSPDGPWFFIIARTEPENGLYQLLGITDTSMLRPQVFAVQEGAASIGLVASEKQAVDATLRSLSEDDPRFRPVADRYWNARGGSHTDGGAFSFTLRRGKGGTQFACADKFGRRIGAPPGEWKVDTGQEPEVPAELPESFSEVAGAMSSWDFGKLRGLLKKAVSAAREDDKGLVAALELLLSLNDLRFDCGSMRRSVVLQLVREAADTVLDSVPGIGDSGAGGFRRIDWTTKDKLRNPRGDEKVLVIFARDFQPEGEDCEARLTEKAYRLGWKRIIIYGMRGQRFTGCGLGPGSEGVRIDVLGSSGDYLASGLDGAGVHVHGSGQDQLGQIMKRGRLVVYGDVGQAFMYGAKGGEVFVMGNAAGRPLINAVGSPRVIINGTCLDYLAESFMAGDPHEGGGFVILNGIEFDDKGIVRPQSTPYPGGNLFSLASGGVIYVRDPHRQLVPEQLNGGEFADLTNEDWDLILPYLKANEGYFGIAVEEDLLTVDGELWGPDQVYHKVRAVRLAVLS
ncbi:glutamate synthase, partial [Elusimicrobiota bacterium]